MDWHTANQHYLVAALAVLRAHLQQADATTAEQAVQDIAAEMEPPAALEALCASFGLSPFEREVLLLCAGVELDATFATLYGEGQPGRVQPTFGLALARLPESHWSALTPTAPLRHWRLIEMGPGDTLVNSPLRIDERVLHYLVGVPCLDTRLLGLVEPVPESLELPPSHAAIAERILAWLANGEAQAFLQLCGGDQTAAAAIAARACAGAGRSLYAWRVTSLPADVTERHTLSRLWEREAVLSGSVLLVESEGEAQLPAALAFIDHTRATLLSSSRDPIHEARRPSLVLTVHKPTPTEQQTLWSKALGPLATALDGQIATLVSQFNLSARSIQMASAAAYEALPHTPGTPAAQVVWEACRAVSRPRLGDLAQHIEPVATWDDLVLPELQCRLLREIVMHVRQRTRVYAQWGFAAKSWRGLGINALFAGSSGTGKTLAAEVIAHELRLDLFRIDLSAVVSKYIGETEKNLRRIFDVAEDGGAILLFDEADALFGKRSEVKDSHDRYANIEVSYLLQRMEAYQGLAILTTNRREALDTAFLRRIRFIIEFPFPDARQRTQIWQRVFPPMTPTERLDLAKLARLHVPGGNIRNIALAAAFLAAEACEPVRMTHLLQAARSEYAKLEKPLTNSEVAAWID